MSGDDVKALQLALIEKNTGSSALALASIGANGNFGPVTLQAVIEFQSAQGLDADGVVGSATMVALGI